MKRVLTIGGMVIVLSALVVLTSCIPQPQTQQSQQAGSDAVKSLPAADQQKYNLVNAELAPLNLKIVPQGSVDTGMPNMSQAMQNMTQSQDPMGVGKAMTDAFTNTPLLIWTNQPPTTPVPQTEVDKAMPIVKKQFTGAVWLSEPR